MPSRVLPTDRIRADIDALFAADGTWPTSSKTSPGAPRCDVAAVEDLLLRISAMAEHQPAVTEFDCNPVVVHERGATVLDARVLARGSGGRRV